MNPPAQSQQNTQPARDLYATANGWDTGLDAYADDGEPSEPPYTPRGTPWGTLILETLGAMACGAALVAPFLF